MPFQGSQQLLHPTHTTTSSGVKYPMPSSTNLLSGHHHPRCNNLPFSLIGNTCPTRRIGRPLCTILGPMTSFITVQAAVAVNLVESPSVWSSSWCPLWGAWSRSFVDHWNTVNLELPLPFLDSWPPLSTKNACVLGPSLINGLPGSLVNFWSPGMSQSDTWSSVISSKLGLFDIALWMGWYCSGRCERST